AVRPTVEAAVLDAGEIVGWEVVAEFVAFVHSDPSLAGDWFDGQAHRVAKSGGELASVLAVGIADSDGGADGKFAGVDIAGGTDGDEQMFAVSGEGQVAGVVAAAGKIEKFFRFAETLGGFGVVLEADDAGHVADVNVIVVKSDAERTDEAFGEHEV